MKTKEKCTVPEDYSVYTLSLQEVLVSFFGAYSIGAAGLYIMYGNCFFSLSAAVICGFVFIPLFRKRLCLRRKRRLLLQFRDMLDSMHTSFAAGKNMNAALDDAIHDLGRLHGENSLIVMEISAICEGVRNGLDTDKLFESFAERSGLDDIRSFADTLGAALETGGNLQQTISCCREIICGRIGTEAEIEEVLASNRTELYLMSFMPFVAAAVMRLMGNETLLSSSLLNVLVKTGALLLFILAFAIGKKITDIKI